MGGTVFRVAIGAFLVWLASQMGTFAEEILGRVRESVQASELLEIDRYVYTWSVVGESRGGKVRAPESQAEFEVVLREVLQAAGRDPAKDRWGRPYVFERIATQDPRDVRYRITTTGPDGKLGTPDDINIDRDGDRARIDRDPASIANQALERKRRFDREVVAKLRAVVDGTAAVASAARPARDEELTKRELEASNRELIRLLERGG